MLPSLELCTRGALSSICRERLKAPLVPHDVVFAEFSTELVERLEDGAQKVDNILEEECRSLFTAVVTRVFSQLYLQDPGFNFNTVIRTVAPKSGPLLQRP